jgi:hypothetical protein
MAAPNPSLDPSMIVDKNSNLSTSESRISTKTAYFKYGVGASADQALMEVITKDSAGLTLNDEIPVSDETAYFIQAIDKTPVKFATGVPLVSQNTNIKFPRPEVKNITPEKVVTFLIFKK